MLANVIWPAEVSSEFKNPMVLCQNRIDETRTAISLIAYGDWHGANSYCFNQGLLPATLESKRNAIFSNADTQDHRTSYTRTSFVIKANIQGLRHDANHVKYAYVSSDGRVNFTETGQRRSLCEDATETQPMSNGPSISITRQTTSSEER
ncbi:hypothetical protein DPMN_084813 [Dreissena polymorpha]|uniref:Uncharacterized protein n=1 Tax=Dreissena polymorpha TaxID=45954 RepID=A0A9D4BIV2_DREPO|nr:hypothetical protein DPMN_084813 [Dreissena polymorpha]